MNKIINFFYYAGCYFAFLYKILWTDLDVSIKSALIAAVISLFVVFLQKYQQDVKDRKQLNETEQNKLRYFYFLLKDTYKVVDFFHENSIQLSKSLTVSPFTIPNYNNYPAYSLEAIANKINQEDYYLASVHQLDSDDVAEVLLLCNTLHESESRARNHFRTEFPKMEANKQKLFDSFRDLELSVEEYLLATDSNTLSDSEKMAYNNLQVLANSRHQTIPINMPVDLRLFLSREHFILPIDAIIRPYQHITSLRKIYLAALQTNSYHKKFALHINNVVCNTVIADQIIQDMVIHLRTISKPLEEYIIALPNRALKNIKNESNNAHSLPENAAFKDHHIG